MRSHLIIFLFTGHVVKCISSCGLGFLSVEVMPCTKDGRDIGEEFVDDPSELVRRDCILLCMSYLILNYFHSESFYFQEGNI